MEQNEFNLLSSINDEDFTNNTNKYESNKIRDKKLKLISILEENSKSDLIINSDKEIGRCIYCEKNFEINFLISHYEKCMKEYEKIKSSMIIKLKHQEKIVEVEINKNEMNACQGYLEECLLCGKYFDFEEFKMHDLNCTFLKKKTKNLDKNYSKKQKDIEETVLCENCGIKLNLTQFSYHDCPSENIINENNSLKGK